MDVGQSVGGRQQHNRGSRWFPRANRATVRTGDPFRKSHGFSIAQHLPLSEYPLRVSGKTRLHRTLAIPEEVERLLCWLQEAENGQLCGTFKVLHGPDCQMRPVFHFQFAKNPVQIFLYCALGEMQLRGNFLIQFGLGDQLRNLLLSE